MGELPNSDLDISQREAKLRALKLTTDLEENIKTITGLYGNSPDLHTHRFRIGVQEIPGALFCLENMFDTNNVIAMVKTLQVETRKIPTQFAPGPKLPGEMKCHLLPTYDAEEENKLCKICTAIGRGDTVILFAKAGTALICETSKWEHRSIDEPTTETVIRGPRDGFIETLNTNITLLRRRIKTPHLWFEKFTVGRLTQTDLRLAYIKGLASEDLLAEVRSRLQRIKTDGVLESGHVEEYIEDTPFTVFPMIFRTERPDRVVAALLEGNVAILTEGTPFVLVLPTTFTRMLQAADDYYDRAPIGSLTRILRIFTYLVSILLPGMYVAIVNFHHEFIPTNLLLRIAASREGLPFPLVVEVLLMEFAFEILREAGVRLPKTIGSAISIVGAIVLGEAATMAGIASPIVIIIVALTAIASFTAPVLSIGISARILRFVFIALGGGIRAFRTASRDPPGFNPPLFPTFLWRTLSTPLGPLIWSDWKDTFIRMFHWGLTTRPQLTGLREPRRAKPGQRPGPDRKPVPEPTKGREGQ